MDIDEIRTGMMVKITKNLGTKGFLISDKFLKTRKVGTTGIILSHVSGHGGDVWWIKQGDSIAAYSYNEFEQYLG